MSSRVGVVIRTKDRAVFLARALRDVAAQTFADRHVVIVNDGGNRRVVERVLAESGLAGDVTIIDVPAPGGRCAAANAGVAATDADLVVLHDDDDLWEPTFLATTVAWLDEHPAASGVVTAVDIVYEELREGTWTERERVPFWRDMSSVSLTEMLEINRVVPISFLYRRALHDEVGGYDERLDAVEDWEFLLRLLPAHDIGFIGGRALALWTHRPGATGEDANSMFALSNRHRLDDLLVRDRELAAWIRENGPGLPLLISGSEQRITALFEEKLEEQRRWIRAEIDAHQPVWSRLRRLRRRLSGQR